MKCLSEDRPLLDGFRRGDARALREVFGRFVPYVATILRKGFAFESAQNRIIFCGYDRAFDIEDGIQEVFRRAFSPGARGGYDGLRPYRSYLAAITRNVVIDTYNARKRTMAVFRAAEQAADHSQADWSAAHDPIAGADGGSGQTGKPEQDAESSELRRLIQRFRSTLGDREQLIFRLRYEDGLSHSAIAQQTRFSQSQIKTSETRIRGGLLKYLKKHGYLTTFHTNSPDRGQSASSTVGEST